MEVEQVCLDHGAERVVVHRSIAELDDAIWSQDFDVAVIDLMLAGQSTLPFARQLQDRGTPFVFASGYSDLDSLGAEFPGVVVVGKPYSDTALIAAIRTAAGRSGG
ncbi:MAG: response regulator [Rhizobiaceae bacterium]|nr:response regulator [Rhizobiaceae bacterium]